MFARRVVPPITRCLRSQPHVRPRPRRKFSTSAAAATSQAPSIQSSILKTITTELDRHGPRIDVSPDDITILSGPSDFYEALKHSIRHAKKRIFLSTLYIGKSEHELVACLRDALAANPRLKVSILTDALRGTRETPGDSCASLLVPLIRSFPDQVEVRMYHTPNLTGLRKRIVPKRINEGWGLQHMKLYGVDDSVILSGANLSSDYFTNRQDRYHVFKSPQVTDYFAKIHHTMASVSFSLVPSPTQTTPYTLVWPTSNPAPSPLEDPKGYRKATKALFKPFLEPHPPPPANATLSPKATARSTSIHPLLSLPHSINSELPAFSTLLSYPYPQGTTYFFTAGYFNPHPAITSQILSASTIPNTNSQAHSSNLKGTVLTAHPHANGFYGSAGVSGMLPPAYTLLSRRFLKAASKYAPGSILLREWQRGKVGEEGGWTYHAKGLWITLPKATEGENGFGQQRDTSAVGPSISVIGSSNYTLRSNSLDTEVGAVIVTSDPGLQGRLRREEQNLLKYSSEAGEKELYAPDRRVGIGVRIAMWIVGVVGGAL